MAHEFGGTAFTYPSGLIYPNTEWHPHVCDPHSVHTYKAACAKEYVRHFKPDARTVRTELGLSENWEVISEEEFLTPKTTHYMDEAGAWIGAYERLYTGQMPVDAEHEVPDPRATWRLAGHETLGAI
jgi:hypothetical protein